MCRKREPGENPGLSRSGMQERPPSTALVNHDWEATATRSTIGVRACESENLPVAPDAPRPAAHRLVERRLAVPVAVRVPMVCTR